MIKHEKLVHYPFLAGMANDSYYPSFLVDKGKSILVRLCERIEHEPPKDLQALYSLTHAATEEFNALNEELLKHDSEIETVARDCIAEDVEAIAFAYGFYETDLEELIAPRDW